MRRVSSLPIVQKYSLLNRKVGNVIALIVLIAIGAFVVFEITGAIEPDEGSAADNTIEDVEDKASTGFSLMSLLVIVIVAVVIIGVVLRGMGGMGTAAGPQGAY